MTYKAYYYLKSNGRAPLAQYVINLKDKKAEEEIFAAISWLIDEKCQLPPPYIKHVWKKIYELRLECKGNQYRIFYFIYIEGKIILLDAYTKKTNRIPNRLLKKIQNYYFDYLNHRHEKEFKKKEIAGGSEY
ncbi:type II toxin-antitoxin system RelE/ParE family toxin [Candidatus Peregrinibacteria bacterium]|nr:type II toxin-antitoxin system RelE/ParE family toxin [Candidatus Peregrinibacteria bacterium]